MTTSLDQTYTQLYPFTPYTVSKRIDKYETLTWTTICVYYLSGYVIILMAYLVLLYAYRYNRCVTVALGCICYVVTWRFSCFYATT